MFLQRDDVAVFCREGADKPETDELLRRCAESFSVLSGAETAGAEIVRAPGKKPAFSPECGVFFSVSHTDGVWMCAFARQEVGLDAELVRDREAGLIARRFFHPKEAEYVCGERGRFFKVWTAKESYVKYTGEGITDRFSAFSVTDGDKIADRVGNVELHHVFWREGYAVCIAARRIGTVTLLEV